MHLVIVCSLADNFPLNPTHAHCYLHSPSSIFILCLHPILPLLMFDEMAIYIEKLQGWIGIFECPKQRRTCLIMWRGFVNDVWESETSSVGIIGFASAIHFLVGHLAAIVPLTIKWIECLVYKYSLRRDLWHESCDAFSPVRASNIFQIMYSLKQSMHDASEQMEVDALNIGWER